MFLTLNDESITRFVIFFAARTSEFTGYTEIRYTITGTATDKTAQCHRVDLPKRGFDYKGNVLTESYVRITLSVFKIVHFLEKH
jgi:hypothetical protein